MQQPFTGSTQPLLPKVIKPLVYCEFRVSERGAEYSEPDHVSGCAVFASEVIHEMAFCYQHGLVIQAALVAEGGSE